MDKSVFAGGSLLFAGVVPFLFLNFDTNCSYGGGLCSLSRGVDTGTGVSRKQRANRHAASGSGHHISDSDLRWIQPSICPWFAATATDMRRRRRMAPYAAAAEGRRARAVPAPCGVTADGVAEPIVLVLSHLIMASIWTTCNPSITLELTKIEQLVLSRRAPKTIPRRQGRKAHVSPVNRTRRQYVTSPRTRGKTTSVA
jgi:hypothetical protein